MLFLSMIFLAFYLTKTESTYIKKFMFGNFLNIISLN